MSFESRTVRLIVTAVTAVILSRIVLGLFNDPEGPNLLVVAMGAVLLMLASSAVHVFNLMPSRSGAVRLALAIGIQIIVAAALYLGMR